MAQTLATIPPAALRNPALRHPGRRRDWVFTASVMLALCPPANASVDAITADLRRRIAQVEPPRRGLPLRRFAIGAALAIPLSALVFVAAWLSR